LKSFDEKRNRSILKCHSWLRLSTAKIVNRHAGYLSVKLILNYYCNVEQYFTRVLTIYCEIPRFTPIVTSLKRRFSCHLWERQFADTRLTANNPRFRGSELARVVVKILLSSLTTMTDDMVRDLSLHISTCQNALMTSSSSLSSLSLSLSLSRRCFEKDSASSFVILIKYLCFLFGKGWRIKSSIFRRNTSGYWTLRLLSS